MVIFAPSMWYADLFKLFGWLIVVTAVALLLLPWRWHYEFGKWAIPLGNSTHEAIRSRRFRDWAYLIFYGVSRRRALVKTVGCQTRASIGAQRALAGGDFAHILTGALKGAAIHRCRQLDGRAAILGLLTRGCPVQLPVFTPSAGSALPSFTSPYLSRDGPNGTRFRHSSLNTLRLRTSRRMVELASHALSGIERDAYSFESS